MHGVLVTYRRPADLAVMLDRLRDQDRRLDTLVVVDNDPAESARSLVEARAEGEGPITTYVAMGSNVGPAGGIAVGMRSVLDHAADDDWLLLLDDDDPPRWPDMLGELLELGTRLREASPATAAVGSCGARFDVARARSIRVPDGDLAGAVPVDYIGSGQFPLYSVHAVRSVGAFDEELFFGLDDLEYGLRLAAAGLSTYAHGELWHRGRAEADRLGRSGAPATALGEPTWRRYYSLRNLVSILRRHRHHRGTAHVVLRGIGKPILNLPRSPRLALRHLAGNTRAIGDAYRGRMGLTVEPVGKAPHPDGSDNLLSPPTKPDENAHRRSLRSRELRTVLGRVELSGRTIELGAGAGWQARALREAGVDVVALDLPDTRYRAVQVFPVIPYDGRRIPVRSGSIDGVFSSHVLEHVEDLPALVREIERVLRPGALIAAVVPSPTWRILTIMTKYLVVGRAAVGMASRRRTGRPGPGPAPDPGGPAPAPAAPAEAGRTSIRDLIVPSRHGVRGNALTEVYTFSARAWRRRFRSLGWDVVEVVPLGYAYSGNHLLGPKVPLRPRAWAAKVLGSSSFLMLLERRGSMAR